jgi:hypothetical protein
MPARYLRPSAAAAEYGVSEKTLSRWASRGLIGASKVGGVRLLNASDIADLIAANAVPRTLVPMPAPEPGRDDAWQDDPLWTAAPSRRTGQTKKTRPA